MGKLKILGDKLINMLVNSMAKDVAKDWDNDVKKIKKETGSIINIQSGGSLDLVTSTWISGEHNNSNKEEVDLEKKIEDFLNNYREELLEDCTETYTNDRVKEIKNLIDKIAIWYELRYSEEKLSRIFNYECGEDNVDDIMFKYNPYVKDLLASDNDIKELEWDEFYNAEVFKNSLPYAEKELLKTPICRNLIFISQFDTEPALRMMAELHVTHDGRVDEAEYIDFATGNKINNKELKGLPLKKVIKLFEKRGFKLKNDSELIESLNNYQRRVNRKNGMLDCVMYKLINRDEYSGSLRAYLFAKEFGRNKDIVIKYGINTVADGSKELANQYLKDGGKKDLRCYPICSYKEYNKPVSLNELYSDPGFYNYQTEEERELHQRLVNDLATQLPNPTPEQELQQRLADALKTKLDKERVKVLQARIDRKLEKSKKNR